MPNVPLDTRFVGFAPQTNLQERKSALINSLSQPYTMADIKNSISSPTLDIVLNNGNIVYADSTVYTNCIHPVVNNTLEFDSFYNLQITIDANDITISTASCFFNLIIIPLGSQDLQSISVPNLAECLSELRCQNQTNLTTINIGQIGQLRQMNAIFLEDNALTEETVNYILALLVSLDGNNNTVYWDGSIYLTGGTNAAPAGQGLIDKQTLIDRGASVDTN
jgi:hypothetical protein